MLGPTPPAELVTARGLEGARRRATADRANLGAFYEADVHVIDGPSLFQHLADSVEQRPGHQRPGTTMQRFSTHMAKALAKGAGWLAWFKKETPRRSAMTLHTFTHDNGIEWRASRAST